MLIIVVIGAFIWLGFKVFGNKPAPASEKPAAADEQPPVSSRETLKSVTAPQESEAPERSKSEAIPPPLENVTKDLTAPPKEQPASGSAVPPNVMDSLNAP